MVTRVLNLETIYPLSKVLRGGVIFRWDSSKKRKTHASLLPIMNNKSGSVREREMAIIGNYCWKKELGSL